MASATLTLPADRFFGLTTLRGWFTVSGSQTAQTSDITVPAALLGANRDHTLNSFRFERAGTRYSVYIFVNVSDFSTTFETGGRATLTTGGQSYEFDFDGSDTDNPYVFYGGDAEAAFNALANKAHGSTSATLVLNDTPATTSTEPAKPTGFNVTTSGNTFRLVASVDNGGSAITKWQYKIASSSAGLTAATWTDISQTSDDLDFTTSAIAYSATRHFQVRAVNSVGGGTASDIDSATTGAQPISPRKPTGFSVTASGRAFNLQASVNNGNSPIIRWQYKIANSAGGLGSASWTNIPSSSSDNLNWTTGTIGASQTRYFQVRAVNGIGNGLSSDVDSATTSATVVTRPGQVRTLSETNTGEDFIEWGWDAPSTGGTPTRYEYRVALSSAAFAGNWISVGTNTSATVTGLRATTNYKIQVRGVNTGGAGSSATDTALTTSTAVVQSSSSGEIYLVHLFGKNDGNNPASNVTLRLSTSPYYLASNTYRSRITRLDRVYDMESKLWNTGESTAIIEAENNDGALDSFRERRMLNGEIRRGSESAAYSNSNFPIIWRGPIREFSYSGLKLIITLSDFMGFLNTSVEGYEIDAATFNGEGKPGTVIRSYFSFNGPLFSTGVNSSDVDTSSFNRLDVDYDISLKVLPKESSQNFLSLINRALTAIPYVVAINKSGKIFASKFAVPQSSSNQLNAGRDIRVETILPAAEIKLSYLDSSGDAVSRPNQQSREVKDRWPSLWRSLRGGTIYSNDPSEGERRNSTDRIGRDIIRLFGRRFNRVKFSVDRSRTSSLDLGDNISIVSDNLGFSSGKPGVVTRLQERLNAPSIVEAWVLNDNVDPTVAFSDSYEFTLPAPVFVNRGANNQRFTYTYNFGTLNLVLPSYLTETGATRTITGINIFIQNSESFGSTIPERMVFTITLDEDGFTSDVFEFGYIEFNFEGIVDPNTLVSYYSTRSNSNIYRYIYRDKIVITPGRTDVQSAGSADRIRSWNSDTESPYVYQTAGKASPGIYTGLATIGNFLNSSNRQAGVKLRIGSSPWSAPSPPPAFDLVFHQNDRHRNPNQAFDAAIFVIQNYDVNDIDLTAMVPHYKYRKRINGGAWNDQQLGNLVITDSAYSLSTSDGFYMSLTYFASVGDTVEWEIIFTGPGGDSPSQIVSSVRPPRL